MASMLDHLGRACLHARRQAGLRQIDIATTAGVSHGTVSRFETRGVSPRDLDGMVLAYATDCSVGASALWLQAVHAWAREHE